MATKFYGDKPRSSYVLAAEAAASELDNYSEQASREGNRRRMTPGNEYENPYAGLTNEDARNVVMPRAERKMAQSREDATRAAARTAASAAARDAASAAAEVSMAYGSSIAADVPAGIGALLALGDPNRNAVNIIESAQEKFTYQPRGESAKRVMGYLSTAMEPIANWVREGTDAAIEWGTEAGLPPWMIAGPLAAAEAAIEVIPGPQKFATKAGSFIRLAEKAAAEGLDIAPQRRALLGGNEPLPEVRPQVDADFASAALPNDPTAGGRAMVLRDNQDASLNALNNDVQGETRYSAQSDEDIKALMDQPMGRRGGDVPANDGGGPTSRGPGSGGKGAEEVKLMTDNPGGEWLLEQQARAKKTGYLGDVTGYLKDHKPVMVDPKDLEFIPGARGEHRVGATNERGAGQKAEALRESIRSGEKIREPIFITVGYDGKPLISEGNNRLAVAIQEGLTEIPVEIRWFAGGELADGPLSPDNLRKIVKTTDTTPQLGSTGVARKQRGSVQDTGAGREVAKTAAARGSVANALRPDGDVAQLNPTKDAITDATGGMVDVATEGNKLERLLDALDSSVPGQSQRVTSGSRPSIDEVRRALEAKSFTGDIPDVMINGQKMEIRNPNDAVKLYEFALARKQYLDGQYTDLTNSLLNAKRRDNKLNSLNEDRK